MNFQKDTKNPSTGKYDHAKKENKNNNQESYSANLISTDDKVNMLKNNHDTSGSSQKIVDENLKVNINQSVLKEGTTTASFKTDSDTTDDGRKKGNEEVHYKGSTGAAEGTPVRTTTECVAHNNSNSTMCSNNNVNVKKVPSSQEENEKSEASPPAYERKSVNKDPPAIKRRSSASKGDNDDKKTVETSVDAPPFNTPQKGSNNDAEEAQYAKMQSRVSIKQNNEKDERNKKENATMGEGTKSRETIHGANIRESKNTTMNKNKGVVTDDLDVITEKEGKTERGPKDDHSNDHINSSVNGTASGRTKKTCPFNRREYQKDKENSNEETSSNNVTSQKNGNYKKFPAFNNAKNGASFKEVRRNNPNIGSSNRKSEKYKSFGHSKKDEFWKSYRGRNEDYNTTSGDYFRRGENYKNEESYASGGNSPNSSNNSYGGNNEQHRANERGFKNDNPHTYRNAINNGGYKNVGGNVGGTAQMENSTKMNDNFHNADNYKMSNYRNHYRNGYNEDPRGSANRYGEKSGSHESGLSTGVKQKDTQFHAVEKYAKKYDSNYFERNDSANVAKDSGSASKKKVNSFSKQIQSTNYSKHLPISGYTKGKETNGYEENDSIEIFTEGDASRNSTEFLDKQIIHGANHTSSSGTYHNSGEKTHNNIPRAGKKNSTAMGSPSHHDNIEQVKKAYAKLTHISHGKDNKKESITVDDNSDHMKSENKCSFIPKPDISDSDRRKINNSGEKDVMKQIKRKEYKKGDYRTLEGDGSGAHVKKTEQRATHFTAHLGDSTKSHVPTNGHEYHHAGANGDEEDHANSVQSEEDKNPQNGGKQYHANGPENKRKMFAPKRDQRSINPDEGTFSFDFKEFECWMRGRYNKLLEIYIDQENRKKNNSEIFEEEIKLYEFCSAYTNSGLEKDSHENLSQMTETLGSLGIIEEDAARSKDNTDVQTNSEMANERELVIERRGGLSTGGNKGGHVNNAAGDSYNSARSNYFSVSKNHMHVLNSNGAHQGENKYYQRNNNYRPNHQKRPLQLFHKNGPQNNRAPFFSFSSGKKWDNSGRTGGEEVVENAIEDAKLEGKPEENTDTNGDMNTENNAQNNTNNNADNDSNANATSLVKKYSAHNRNNQAEEKTSDGNFNRKTYYEKRPAGKPFGSTNITTKKPSSNNGFYKNKYHTVDQKNDCMRSEMNNGTFYKSNRQPMGQHNNKRNNWSTKLVNNRFGNRYEEPFGEPFGERPNERFSKQNNSKDMDHTNAMFYASKKRIDNYVLPPNEMGTAAAHNSNLAGNSKKSNSTYLTAKSEGAKNRKYE
ncbi:hypothetical protein C922_01115 [Plasmodium inui San Antonio 1]|uniref:Uncharacterized protein n=1 Tax=Plasmodium inui San Antonio 1 TaxID=1237626 RepID=W7AAH7_9APIC|nr:hypothetical protein C922_01115 [Plasmodium inui San Antonio 1]EUD68715.1 hypothetical protein C922_01115 [Plasmodium inui San Antonio 1]